MDGHMHAIRYAETATELAAATLLQRQFKLETYVDCNSLTMHMQQWLRLSDMLIGKLIGRTRHKIVHAQNESVASVCCFACSGSAPCTAWQMHTKTSTAQHSTAGIKLAWPASSIMTCVNSRGLRPGGLSPGALSQAL